jgi:hypothetical protein
VPIKFKTKPHMKGGPKYALDDPEPLPENEDAPDHEPVFKIKDFPQNYVTFHAHKNTAGPRKPRHHNVVHISDLDPSRNWCPREPALLTLHGERRPDAFLTTAQSMVFKMGNKGADLLIESLPPEQVWGHWKCLACDHVTKFSYTPKACPSCGAKRAALKYQEVLVRDPETGIVGSVDCFVDILSNGLRTGVEIKTEGKDDFKSRTKATFDHEWRSKGYLWLMARDPVMKGKGLNLSEMRIIYFTKEGWEHAPHIKDWPIADAGKTALKEYWCPKGEDMLQNQLALVTSYRKWRNSWDAVWSGAGPMGKVEAKGELPARHTKCKSIGCTMAKACPVRKQCWGST